MASPPSRGVSPCHARHAGPTHRDAPRRPRGASDSASLRSGATRPKLSGQNLPSRDGSLRFDRLASLVRGGDLRSVHCDRAVAMGPTHRVQPKGLSGGKGQSPHVVRMCKHIRLSGHWTYRPSSRASTAHAADDGPMTSSDGAPKSHHPATLCPLAKGSTCMPQESGMVDPIASLLSGGGCKGGLGPPCRSRAQWGSHRGSHWGSPKTPKMAVFGTPRVSPCVGREIRIFAPGAPGRPGGPPGPPARPPGRGAPRGGPGGVSGGSKRGSKRGPKRPPKMAVFGPPRY